jgi:N-acetyl sugar amidotransferase
MYMSAIEEVFWCSECVAMSTRPRIGFDSDGRCNACQWADKKQKLNWASRLDKLNDILQRQKTKGKPFDCLVPVSGGKDGSYVAYQLKHVFNMNPLCVTVQPPLASDIGIKNLHNFIAAGYDHIMVSPNKAGMQKLNKAGFVEMGFPYYGWLVSIHTAVIRVAQQHKIDLIFYGEDGEVEYGGTIKTEDSAFYDVAYQKKVYLENGYEKVLRSCGLSPTERFFFEYPENIENSHTDIKLTHWSYFENWDSYRNYMVAKEHCGLIEAEATNSGTFTNFAQNDQHLYPLHSYLMFLKYGFGRANQDACIDVRRGAMSRDQAVNLVRIYDGQFPEEYLDSYLDYFDMTKEMFFDVLDKWANKDLLEKADGRWKPKFTIS